MARTWQCHVPTVVSGLTQFLFLTRLRPGFAALLRTTLLRTMADEKSPASKPAEGAAAKDAKSAAAKKPAAKKAKPPKLEDKPFNEFIEKHYVPELKKSLEAEGIKDLALTFAKQNFEPLGQECWQVRGRWGDGQRQFMVAFSEEDIKATKAFSLADAGATPSDVEPFLSDERRINLDLLIYGVVQRLDGQKWLGRN